MSLAWGWETTRYSFVSYLSAIYLGIRTFEFLASYFNGNISVFRGSHQKLGNRRRVHEMHDMNIFIFGRYHFLPVFTGGKTNEFALTKKNPCWVQLMR